MGFTGENFDQSSQDRWFWFLAQLVIILSFLIIGPLVWAVMSGNVGFASLGVAAQVLALILVSPAYLIVMTLYWRSSTATSRGKLMAIIALVAGILALGSVFGPLSFVHWH